MLNSRPTPIQVVAFCGSLPLALAIAGSMPVVKGKGLNAGAWEELIKLFEDVAEKMDALGEQRTSLSFVLETSFNALAAGKKKEFLKMAVLAPGAIAPIEMLPNLWEIQVRCGVPSTRCLFVGCRWIRRLLRVSWSLVKYEARLHRQCQD